MSQSDSLASLYHAAWHALFFPDSCSIAQVCHFLRSVGYTLADPDCVQAAVSAVNESQKAMREEIAASSDCMPRCFGLAAAEAVLATGVSRRDQLLAALGKVTGSTDAQSGPSRWFKELAQQLTAAGSSSSTHSSELIFTISGGGDNKATENSAEAMAFFNAKIYAAMCFLGSFSTVRPLAKMLMLYIHQGPPTGSSSPVVQASASLCSARAKGVVAGILEAALCIARYDTQRVVAALHALTTAEKDDAQDGLAAGWMPAAGQSRAVTHCAAMVLVQLVTQAAVYERAAGGSSSEGAIAFRDDSMAVEVVHAVQELLFTLIMGGGTEAMANRPVPAAAPVKKQQALETAAAVCVVTSRALTLEEADSLTQLLFPSLVQQLGFEWPWSAFLRHARTLDKQQHIPSFPGVAWGSRLVMDTIMLSIGEKRTYRDRLQNILPESYDRVLEALDLLPLQPQRADADAADDAGGAPAVAPLFVLPQYYSEAGTSLIEYFQRTGLGGLRAEEVERVLTQGTSTLPMTARLRACAPPAAATGSNTEGTEDTAEGSGRYPLSSSTVNALQCRYRLEVLLAAVVVYTQLRVVSQVQQLMRILAPIMGKLQMSLTRHDEVSPPLLAPLRNNENNIGSESKQFPFAFSKVAERLMNDVGYEFYPLEWVPVVAHAYNAMQSQGGDVASAWSSSPAQSLTVSAHTPYSAYAAVAHQFGAALRVNIGSSGDIAQCRPSGLRSDTTTPSFNGKLHLMSRSSADSASMMTAWRRASAFVEKFMAPVFLDSRTSSCELEGTLAVAATRRVATTSSAAAASAAAGPLASAAIANLSGETLETFWRVGGKRARAVEGDKEAAAEEEAPRRATASEVEAIRSLTDTLLRHGASSFADHLEAKDFLSVVAQCFLPHTYAATSKPQEVLRAALSWCQETVGAPSDRSRLHMLQQQQQQAASALPTLYNSCTWDASCVARRIIHAVPGRILEKMRQRQRAVAELHRRRDTWIRTYAPDSASTSTTDTSVDALLSHQWSRWCQTLRHMHLMEDLAALPTAERMQLTSAAQWLWYSPYATRLMKKQ